MKRNVFALSLLAATVACAAVYAVEQEIEVSARMRVGLSFANKVDMDFSPGGYIDFYGAPDPLVDFVELGSDGNITVQGTVFQPSAMVGTPGRVDIVGDGSSTVVISCDTTATLEEAGTAHQLTMDQAQLTMNTPDTFLSPDYTCAGLGTTPHTYTLTGVSDTIFLGGRLVGSASVTTALYSTAIGAGVPVTVRVLYQ